MRRKRLIPLDDERIARSPRGQISFFREATSRKSAIRAVMAGHGRCMPDVSVRIREGAFQKQLALKRDGSSKRLKDLTFLRDMEQGTFASSSRKAAAKRCQIEFTIALLLV